MNYFDKAAKQVLQDLKTDLNGLSSDEALARLQKFGYNELIEKKPKSKLLLFLKQFQNFIVYILISATIVSAFIGEYIDSIAIAVILILNAVFGFIQEYKAEKAIAALKRLASLQAKVVRNSSIQRIAARELVPGDIILVETGDKVPADCRLVDIKNLEAEEASLTGESVPVKKLVEPLEGKLSLGDQKNMLFSGTVITKGRATAVVVQTGMATELGKIAGLIQSVKEEATPLQQKLKKLGAWLGYLTLAVCAIVFVSGLFRGEKLLNIFMVSVALAVAVIPEGLPAVVTISLALGVQRMVRRNALVRNLPSVETLGATTVICTDKTGTLTKNEMTVTRMYSNFKVIEVTGSGYDPKGKLLCQGKPVELSVVQMLVRIGLLNNDAVLKDNEVIGDPTEASLLVSAAKAGIDSAEQQRLYPRVDEIQFDSARKRMVTIHDHDGKHIAFVKGAPEIVLSLCTRVFENGGARILSNEDKEKILAANKEFASQALRVLGFAYKHYESEFKEEDLVFVGLQAMIDPPREEVKLAIRQCNDAGIKVVMVTGDYEETAKAIAKDIGIIGRAINASELDTIELEKEVESIGIYARVNPEHKIQIVDALQKKGHIVAMTGDGVNDAPALKKAHIGIAMGIKGTDVAKESSAMILTDDNFASIVSAIEEGRGIEDNIKKFVNYLLSCNFGELLVLFVAMIIGFKDAVGAVIIPLVAVQLLWVNLVTDGLPALALGVDPIDPNIMKRKPRDPKAPIISRNMTYNVFATGALICLATLFAFWFGLRQSPIKAQTLAFTTIVFLEMARVQIIRQQYHTGIFSNRFLVYAVLASILAQLLVVFTPINTVFNSMPMNLTDVSVVLALCAGVYIAGTLLTKLTVALTKQFD
ncbi:MAG: calcium-translocating P-type ATPase, PMCA-type [Candidatus Woesearchaeota archaeon]